MLRGHSGLRCGCAGAARGWQKGGLWGVAGVVGGVIYLIVLLSRPRVSRTPRGSPLHRRNQPIPFSCTYIDLERASRPPASPRDPFCSISRLRAPRGSPQNRSYQPPSLSRTSYGPRERIASASVAPIDIKYNRASGLRARRRGPPQNRRNRPSSLSCTSYSPRERSAAAKIAPGPILVQIASPGPARYGTAKKGKNKSSQIAPTSSVSSRSTWLYIVHRGAELIIFLQDEVFTFL